MNLWARRLWGGAIFLATLPYLIANACYEIMFISLIRFFQRSFPRNIKNQHVLITGCDTGFGRMLAEQLDDEGCHVYALCLTEQSVKELSSRPSGRVMALRVDVTQPEQVTVAYQTILRKTSHLDALFNNAGIIKGYLVEWTSLADVSTVMNVNYLAAVNVAKTFLPLLLQAKPQGAKCRGRIINIASCAGRTSSPGMSAYCASKHAMEAFNDAFRLELHGQIDVIVIEPGFMKTPILKHGLDSVVASFRNLPDEVRQRYDEATLLKITQNAADLTYFASHPQQVVDVMKTTVKAWLPSARYVVGWDARLIFVPLARLPAFLADPIVLAMMPIPQPRK